MRRPDQSRESVERMYRSDPVLADRVRELWPAEYELSYPGYPELSIAAHAGGMLLSEDGPGLLGHLNDLFKRTPHELPLTAELPQDRARILGRLEVLRSSGEHRRRYVELLSDIWERLGPEWEDRGLPLVLDDAALRRADMGRATGWRDVVPETCQSMDRMEEMVAALGNHGELVVVPVYFTVKGKMVVDLPDTLLVAVGADESSLSRARCEQLARQLKAISDPTRLAILEGLARRDMTVTEIAHRHALAQPTVSNHVKLLRETGLVAANNDGRSRRLTARLDVVDEIVGELQGLLGRRPNSG
jgi:DNA-binding transcriptional ArsR family regulator